LRKRVEKAIAKVSDNGWVDDLKVCPTVEKTHKKLLELLPEISEWDIPIARNQLFFNLQKIFKIDLGVCDFLLIEDKDDHRQYCLYSGRKNECTCRVPQPFCVFRDQDGKPRYPEFFTRQEATFQLSLVCPPARPWKAALPL